MNKDFAEMLSALSDEHVDFIVVGAHALAAHGLVRATGDIDIWVRPTSENAGRVISGLKRFGAPLHDLTIEDLTKSDTVFQIGVPPGRIDLLSGISGVSFDDAWPRSLEVDLGFRRVRFLSREDMVANKRASGRPKDLLDLEWLEKTKL
ncbi:MAG: DUF6036 family nucleotidyltransferase [Polyangiaceae bacterium]